VTRLAFDLKQAPSSAVLRRLPWTTSIRAAKPLLARLLHRQSMGALTGRATFPSHGLRSRNRLLAAVPLCLKATARPPLVTLLARYHCSSGAATAFARSNNSVPRKDIRNNAAADRAKHEQAKRGGAEAPPL
jgi:hypothetical protein